MPYAIQQDQTPNALRITRLAISGKITEDEAANLMQELGPGGRHSGLPLLVISDDSTEVGAAARRIFTSQARTGSSQQPISTAVVTRNTVMRVTVNFIGRVNRDQTTRLFSSEAEAVSWLEQAAAAKATEPGA